MVETVVSVMAVGVSVLVIFAHERVLYLSREPPVWLCKLVRITRRSDDYSQLPQFESFKIRNEPLSREMNLVLQTLKEIREDIAEKAAVSESPKNGFQEETRLVKWQRIFSFIDIVSMFFFLAVNTVITLAMFRSNIVQYLL